MTAHPSRGCPVVGIGGSAGGLKAYRALLAGLPSDTGMAFVVIAHVSPVAKSRLVEILSRSTQMPVTEAADGQAILTNQVYIIPPNVDLTVEDETFKVQSPRTLRHGRHHQVDTFLISLAKAKGSAAIGVILSGGDGDGTEGCRVIKAHGGQTFAQDLSAEVESMPLRAEAGGNVDFVLSPRRISEELVKIATAKKAAGASAAEGPRLHQPVPSSRVNYPSQS